MLSERIVSAIIGIILFIFFIFWGSLPFCFLVLVLTVLAMSEYSHLLPFETKKNKVMLLIFSLFIIIYTYLSNKGIINWPKGLIIFIALFFLITYHILINGYQDIVKTLSANLLGLIYISGGLAFFILLRDFNLVPFGQTRALWVALITTWATDTGAYFMGRFFGKNQLAPNISPNKTIEGAIGGMMSSVLAISIFTIRLQSFSYYWLLYGFLVSIIAIAGDLFESAIKRDMGVKDSGKIIPGHGGILDRFDSLLFTAPFTYYILVLFLK